MRHIYEYDINPEFETILLGESQAGYESEQEYEYEEESFWDTFGSSTAKVFQTSKDRTLLNAAYNKGTINENDLSNMLFYDRHPNLSGQRLTRDMPDFDILSKEWLTIRDSIVRPFINEKMGPTGGAVIGSPDTSGNMPPVEGPVKGITGYVGKSGKKCWSGAKSADIIDSDCPWNKPGNRSAANYIAVLDYFNVGETDLYGGTGNSIVKPGENPRYRQEPGKTWCNIYVHDATRAMWASMPHWVKSSSGSWNELTANAMVDWATQYGKAAGWNKILSEVGSWIQRGDIPQGLRSAVQRIIASAPPSSLASQPSWLAQQFANMGYPTAAIYKNVGGIGHVAMIRPEDHKKGELISGVFIPRSAQAGAKNYSSGKLCFSSSSVKSGIVQFYVHE